MAHITEHALIPVPFHTDTLFLIQHEGEPFVPVKPIVENLGLDWKVQHRKLTADSDRWGMVIMTIPSMGGMQETSCLPLSRIFGFLMTIEPSRVKETARPKVIEYQKHCDKVLADYWTGQQQPAPQPPMIQFTREGLESFMENVVEITLRVQTRLAAQNKRRGKVPDSDIQLMKQYARRGIPTGEIARRTGWDASTVRDHTKIERMVYRETHAVKEVVQ